MTASLPGMRNRGTWASGVSYRPQDVVQRSGVSYIALTANTSNQPPSGAWLALSGGTQGAQGFQGSAGTQGAQGSQGIQGPQGSPQGVRALTMGLAGTIPTTAVDTSDFFVVVPYTSSVTGLKAACRVAPPGAMAIQVRRSTNAGVSWSNLSGVNVTFAGGAFSAVMTPSTVTVNENDILGFSVTANGGGLNLIVEVVVTA